MKILRLTICMLTMTLVLAGCTSHRFSNSRPSDSQALDVSAIPTLASSAENDVQPELPPVPTTPAQFLLADNQSQPDASSAIPEESLEALGLQPVRTWGELTYEAERHGGQALYANLWSLQPERSSSLAYVMDLRFSFPTTSSAQRFVQETGIVYGQSRGRWNVERVTGLSPIGDISYVWLLSRPGQHIWVAVFSVNTNVGVIYVVGTEDVSQDTAIDLMAKASNATGYDQEPEMNLSGKTAEPSDIEGEWFGWVHYFDIDDSGGFIVEYDPVTSNRYFYSLDELQQGAAGTITARVNASLPILGTPGLGSVRSGDTVIFQVFSDPSGDFMFVEIVGWNGQPTHKFRVCRFGEHPQCEVDQVQVLGTRD